MHMHNYGDIFAPIIGRILMGGFFVWSGVEATLNFPATIASMANVGAPMPTTFAIVAILIEVLCGIAIVVGFKTSQAALVLALYVIAVAFFYTGLGTNSSQALFLQDMAIVGGLLYISAYGAGSWATDWHYKR
jgi:putative oxidoreductase